MSELITTQSGIHNTNKDRRKYFKERKKMPMTKKGKKIMGAMTKQYGAKKGKQVFYASKNKGVIKGVEKNMPGMSVHPVVSCSEPGRHQSIPYGV